MQQKMINIYKEAVVQMMVKPVCKKFCPFHLFLSPNECWCWLPGVCFCCVSLLTCSLWGQIFFYFFILVNDSVHEVRAEAELNKR